MSTRIILQTSIRLILDDIAIWPDADLLQWINDAISDYCNYFPEEFINDTTVTSTGNCLRSAGRGAWCDPRRVPGQPGTSPLASPDEDG
jgi:hypothetical protein